MGVCSLWETGGTKWARVAWFSTPEALRIRRKKGHGKRELFASHEDDIEVWMGSTDQQLSDLGAMRASIPNQDCINSVVIEKGGLYA